MICTDLDGTLFCSGMGNKARHGYVCAAVKSGKPASFISLHALELLCKVAGDFCIIPVTTRCRKSYENVLIRGLFPYALVNGGAELVCGNQDMEELWKKESRRIAGGELENLEKARKIIERLGYIEKWGSPFVLDYVCEGKHMLGKEAKEEIMAMDGLICIFGKSSIRISCRSISKGTAIQRIADMTSFRPFISCGDSIEDQYMFSETMHSIGCKGAEHFIQKRKGPQFCIEVVEKIHEICFGVPSLQD